MARPGSPKLTNTNPTQVPRPSRTGPAPRGRPASAKPPTAKPPKPRPAPTAAPPAHDGPRTDRPERSSVNPHSLLVELLGGLESPKLDELTFQLLPQSAPRGVVDDLVLVHARLAPEQPAQSSVLQVCAAIGP